MKGKVQTTLSTMTHDPEIHRVLREQLHDPDGSFSIGSFGAIAEFHRDADEPLILDEIVRSLVGPAGCKVPGLGMGVASRNAWAKREACVPSP